MTLTQVPVVAYLDLDGDEPHLTGWECAQCGAIFLDRRVACPSCTSPGFTSRRLASRGTVRAFTIVHRAPPTVRTPFVAAIVDLDGGGVVKANVVGIDPDPVAVRCGQRVRLSTYPVGVDKDGTEAVGFGFEIDTKEA